MSIRTSTSLVASTSVMSRDDGLVARSSLQMGDLFTKPGSSKIREHTGLRTCPPSEVKRGAKTYGTQNDKTIIGFQSRVVSGTIKANEDGASVSFDGDRRVKHVGQTSLTLKKFRS